MGSNATPRIVPETEVWVSGDCVTQHYKQKRVKLIWVIGGD